MTAMHSSGTLTAWFEDNFHRIYLFLLFPTVLGAVFDGHDHAHGGVSTIYTAGHMINFASVLLIAFAFAALLIIRHRRGQGWWEAIPEGYHHTAVALPLFIVGFAFDQTWHILFGFEQGGIEVMSPPHIWVLVAGLYLATGPLRRAWYRGVDRTWKSQFGMLSSAGFLIWILSYMMRLLYPYLTTYAASWHPRSGEFLAPRLGVAGILVMGMLILWVLLQMAERFDVVPGGLTYTYSIGAFGMIAVGARWYFLPAAILTGFSADLLNTWLRPSKDRLLQFRLFAFLFPAMFALFYHLTIMLTGEIVWVVHVWTGSIIFAGVVGLLLSHVMCPTPKESSMWPGYT